MANSLGGSTVSCVAVAYGVVVSIIPRPPRVLDLLVDPSLVIKLGLVSPMGDGSSDFTDAAWQRVYDEHLQWKAREVDAIAKPYFDRRGIRGLTAPLFNTKAWWA